MSELETGFMLTQDVAKAVWLGDYPQNSHKPLEIKRGNESKGVAGEEEKKMWNEQRKPDEKQTPLSNLFAVLNFHFFEFSTLGSVILDGHL